MSGDRTQDRGNPDEIRCNSYRDIDPSLSKEKAESLNPILNTLKNSSQDRSSGLSFTRCISVCLVLYGSFMIPLSKQPFDVSPLPRKINKKSLTQDSNNRFPGATKNIDPPTINRDTFEEYTNIVIV